MYIALEGTINALVTINCFDSCLTSLQIATFPCQSTVAFGCNIELKCGHCIVGNREREKTFPFVVLFCTFKTVLLSRTEKKSKEKNSVSSSKMRKFPVTVSRKHLQKKISKSFKYTIIDGKTMSSSKMRKFPGKGFQ